MNSQNSTHSLELTDKIKHILEETRVILPGTQAILGFQLVAVFSNGFDKLFSFLKNMHIVSLLIVTITTILLLSITSFHRIAEKGKDTNRLNIWGSSILEISLITLVFGISLDIYVIIMAANRSSYMAFLGMLTVFIFALCIWFFIPLLLRAKDDSHD